MHFEDSINSRSALEATRNRSIAAQEFIINEQLNQNYVKKLNAYIFQDMLKLGITYSAGQFREGSKSLNDLNVSSRNLSNITIYSMHSYMDDRAIKRFDDTLKAVDFNRLSTLSTKDFTKEISSIYAMLDYTHPFVDGNSRTFRTLTYQIANTAGFNLNWDKIAQSQKLREDLYCARCKEVNTLALHDQPIHREKISNMLEMLDESYTKRDLNSLLSSKKIIVPNAALDFKESVKLCIYQIKTQDDVKHLIPNLNNEISLLQAKHNIVAFKQIEQLINAPEDPKSPLPKINTIVNAILPASYKLLEQNIKQFEPNILRDSLATEIKNTLEQTYNRQHNSPER